MKKEATADTSHLYILKVLLLKRTVSNKHPILRELLVPNLSFSLYPSSNLSIYSSCLSNLHLLNFWSVRKNSLWPFIHGWLLTIGQSGKQINIWFWKIYHKTETGCHQASHTEDKDLDIGLDTTWWRRTWNVSLSASIWWPDLDPWDTGWRSNMELPSCGSTTCRDKDWGSVYCQTGSGWRWTPEYAPRHHKLTSLMGKEPGLVQEVEW